MRERFLRAGLAALAATAAVVGLWAALWPGSFYAGFPGLGRWVATDGPYNEHLTRDVGELNLALAVVLTAAAVTLSRPLVLAALAAWFVYSAPHVTYHVFTLGRVASLADRAASVAALGVAAVLPVALLWVALNAAPPAGRESS